MSAMAATPKLSTPLPPGVVPSESRNDFSDLVDGAKGNLDEKDPNNIIKEGVLSSGTEVSSTHEAAEVAAISDTPSNAWISPEKHVQTFHIDLSDEETVANTSGPMAIPVLQNKQDGAGEVESGTATSPFVSKSTAHQQDLRRETITGVKNNGSQQTTPKRTMSPLRRFNKVAPSPVKPPQNAAAISSTAPGSLAAAVAQTSSLQSNSASILDEKRLQQQEETAAEKERPGSAPMVRQEGESKQNVAKPITLEPVIVVQSKNGDLVVQEWENQYKEDQRNVPAEPQYSTVVKRKPLQSTDTQTSTSQGYNAPEFITAMPTFDSYEPQPELDSSIVVTNQTAADLDIATTNQELSTVSHDWSYDPNYEEVDSGNQEALLEVQLPEYNPALYKGLKKHDDQARNVHLVSVKGTGHLPEELPMNFPPSSSTDMHPLHYAAATGNKKALNELLSILPITQDPVEMVLGTEKMCKRDGVDIRDSEGRTPLMHAVHQDHVHCVKLLAEAGANVNSTADDGSTCLHQAAYSGSIEMIALLLSIGADGLKRDKEGRMPLHWCTNNKDSKCIELLLEKVPGLSINVRDGAMMTSLMWAAFHCKPSHIKMLLEKGADPAISDVDGMTAVHWSVQRHDTRGLQVLINQESAQYSTKKGKKVMHQAAEQGCAKAVSLIKAVRPTSVNDIDINGRTPLHWATVCENPEVIRALLAHGAEPTIKDSSQKTALDYATEKGLHYCSLLLTKSEGLIEEAESYNSVLTYGTTTAAPGARALHQQEGQLLNVEELKKAMTSEQVLQIQSVCCGAWINKFTNNGKGPLHPRFFWVNPSNCKICWSKSKDASNKDVKSDILVGVRSSASPAVFGRKDFDPMNKHKFAFTIFTNLRVLDVVAVSSEDYKTWLNGLQLLLHLGSINATRLLSVIQKSSGQEPRPIP